MLARVHRAFERGLEWMVIVLMAALALVVVVAVAFRKMGGALVWYDEVAAILLSWLTFYGAALAALKRAHIGFPQATRRWPLHARAAAAVAREIVVVTFFVLVAIAGWRVTWALRGSYLVSLPTVSKALAQSAVLAGGICFVGAELLAAWQSWTSRPRTERQGPP